MIARALWGLSLALSVVYSAGAQEVEVSVELDSPETPFHKQVRFSVIVESPEGLENLEMPDMVGRFGGLNVYGSVEFSRQMLKNGRILTVETYVLDPIVVGDYAIDPVEVRWGEEGKVIIPSPAVRVRDLTEAELAEAEIFKLDLPVPDIRTATLVGRWETWATLGLALAIGGFGLVYFLIKRPRKVLMAPPKKAWEVAYERLRALDLRHYPQSGKYTAYYVDLSAIVRYYIEDRFRVHAPEQTTPEFVTEISGSGIISEDHRKLLEQFLHHCDRVKFARYVPEVHEMESYFTEVLRFVDETVPSVEEASEEAA